MPYYNGKQQTEKRENVYRYWYGKNIITRKVVGKIRYSTRFMLLSYVRLNFVSIPHSANFILRSKYVSSNVASIRNLQF